MSTATISAPLALPAPAKATATSPIDFAVQQILAKQGKQAILSQLSARYGLSSESALTILNHAYALKHAAFRQAGFKTLQTGVVMLFLGILATAIGYSLVKDGGGTYLVFYGLMGVGVFRILAGLFRIAVG